MTPSERSQRARLAAHVLHSQRDGREVTAPARKAFLERFERQVDPEGVLDSTERRRRAKHALKAHMAALALRSAASRRCRKHGT